MSIPSGYDIAIDGTGYLRDSDAESIIGRADRLPVTTRAAMGEGRFDTYQDDAYYAQANFAGGMGQERLYAQDAYLVGSCLTQWGRIFPALKKGGTLVAGSSGRYFRFGNALYNMVDGVPDGVYNPSGPVPTDATGTTGSHSVIHPVTTTINNTVLFPSAGQTALHRWRSGNVETVTPPGAANVDAVATLGRFVYALGRENTPQGPTVVQSGRDVVTVADINTTLAQATSQLPGGADAVSWNFPNSQSASPSTFNGFEIGNTLLVGMVFKNASALRTIAIPPDNRWIPLRSAGLRGTKTAASNVQVQIWMLPKVEKPVERMDFSFSGDPVTMAVGWVELSGLDPKTIVEDMNSSAATVGTPVTTATTGAALGSSRSDFYFGVLGVPDAGVGLAVSAGWTAVYDSEVNDGADTDLEFVIAYDIESTGTNTLSDTISSNLYAGAIVSLRGNGVTTSQKSVVLWYSEDEGENWRKVSGVGGPGLGQVRAMHAAQGALWVATDRGLFIIDVEEQALTDGSFKQNAAMTGPVDEWNQPYESNYTANWLAVFEGAIYYNLGGTVRRFIRNGVAAVIWPTPEWAITTGGSPVTSLVAGEGGLFWSAGGVVWNFSGRGMHVLGEGEGPLFLHRGRIYVTGEQYFMLPYPHARPDQSNPTFPEGRTGGGGTIYQTGYLVTSALDFDAPLLDKLISRFATQCRFTAATNSGSVTLQYALGCTAGPDPSWGGLDGAPTGVTWVDIGTHVYADGGIKTYGRKEGWDLAADEISCRRLYLRLVIEPGTEGYPIVEALAAYGLIKLPNRKQLTIPIRAFVGQPGSDGATKYLDSEDVADVLDQLEALRDSSQAFDVLFDDGDEEISYRVVAAEQDQALRGRMRSGLDLSVQARFIELP